MTKINTFTQNFNQTQDKQVKNTNKSNTKVQQDSDIAQKARNFVGAGALAAVIMGSMGLQSCSQDDYLGEIEPKQEQINTTKSTSNKANETDSISYTQAKLMKLGTPAARLDYISNDLGFDDPIYYSGDKAAAIEVTNGTQYDEVYAQRAKGTYLNGYKVYLTGLNVHRKTDDKNTQDTGSKFGMIVTNKDDGSIIMEKTYLSDDAFLGKNKGDIETITVTPVENSTYTETTTDNNGNSKSVKIFVKDGVTYRQNEDGNLETMSNYKKANNQMPNPITFNAGVEDWVNSVTNSDM